LEARVCRENKEQERNETSVNVLNRFEKKKINKQKETQIHEHKHK